MRALATALLALLGACTFEAGSGFATVEDATLTTAFDPSARAREDGRFLALGGYYVAVDTIDLDVGAVTLERRVVGDDGFPGYEPMVTMPIDGTLDLGASTTTPLTVFDPSPELERGTIARSSVEVRRLRLTGRVTGGSFGTEDLALAVDVALDGSVRSEETAREIGVDTAEDLHVALDVVLDGTVLDGVLFELHETPSGIQITDEDTDAAERIALDVLATPVSVAFE